MKKLLGSMELNRIYQFDCTYGMKLVPEESVDLIIADPPYNIGGKGVYVESDDKHHKTIKEDWDTITDFEAFNLQWLTDCFRLLKQGGSILAWGTHHNIYQLGYLIEKIGYQMRTPYVWLKTNPAPNWIGKSPCAATEYLIWATKGAKPTYNLDYAKSINGGKNIKNVFQTSLTPPSEKKHGKFPCQKRMSELTNHLVKLHSNEGEIVLVPFAGSGTECIASQINKRNWIAFETNREYIELANMRLDDVADLADF